MSDGALFLPTVINALISSRAQKKRACHHFTIYAGHRPGEVVATRNPMVAS